MKGYTMRVVVREFLQESRAVPGLMKRMVELDCGHSKRDPWETYGNETAVRIADACYHIDPNPKPRRCRCYQCKKDQP